MKIIIYMLLIGSLLTINGCAVGVTPYGMYMPYEYNNSYYRSDEYRSPYYRSRYNRPRHYRSHRRY